MVYERRHIKCPTLKLKCRSSKSEYFVPPLKVCETWRVVNHSTLRIEGMYVFRNKFYTRAIAMVYNFGDFTVVGE